MKIHSTTNPHVIGHPLSEQAATAKPGRVSAKDLKHLITSRSKDYLMRMLKHGTSQQKQLATSTVNALDNEKFIPNPATQLPVQQFGIASTLDGQEGVLMANFRLHDKNLELAAIGFQNARELNRETGPVVILALEDAKNLKGVGLPAHLGDRPSRGNSGAKTSSLKPEVGTPVAIRPAPTPIQPRAARIAKAQDQGISKFTAGLRAHIELREATTAKVIGKNSPEEQNVSLITVGKRLHKGLEYEFPPESFYRFHEEHLGTFEAPNIKGDRKGPDRHAGGVMGKEFIDKINKKIPKDTEIEPVPFHIAERSKAYDKLSGKTSTEPEAPHLAARSEAYDKLSGKTPTKPAAPNIGIKRASERDIDKLPLGSNIKAVASLELAIEKLLGKPPAELEKKRPVVD